MLCRAVLLAFLVLPVVACVPAPYTVTQHGLISAPRAASYDGQPLRTSAQFEAHASTTRVTGLGRTADSGAAVAQHSAGGSLREAINHTTDFGAEVDGAWSATDATLSGDSSVSTGVPVAAVIDAALALRTSVEIDARTRVGFALAMGLSSNPIHREGTGGGSYDRDESLLVRAALVPSYKLDQGLTLYASIGGSTQADIKETFVVVPDSTSNNDPGVVSEADQIVLTLAAGATIDVGERTHVMAQLAGALGRDATFGPQLLAGLAFDLGMPRAR